MAELFGFLIPFSLAFLATQLISTGVAFLAIVIADNYIGHNIEIKRTLFLSVASFFIIPLLITFLGIRLPFMNMYAPLISWMILGELLLDNDFSTKLKVLGIAFFVYYVLNVIVQPFALGLTGF